MRRKRSHFRKSGRDEKWRGTFGNNCRCSRCDRSSRPFWWI